MSLQSWEVITTNRQGKPSSVDAHSFFIKLPERASDAQIFKVMRDEGHFGSRAVRDVYRFRRRKNGQIYVLFHGTPEYLLQRTVGEGRASWVHYKKRPRHPKGRYL